MSLAKSTIIIGSFTMISRVFGFVRDIFVANTIGASWLSDAFFVAFKLPNFFRRLFAEGAFNAAFVPLFAGNLAKQGKEMALKFAGDIFSILLIILLALNAVMFIAMPYLMHIFAPGFAEDLTKFSTTVTLSRIAFPYILFISLAALLSGILNSMGRFASVAATPVLLNISLISALLFFDHLTQTPAHALAWGVSVAGVLQLGWLVYQCKKHDILPHWSTPKLNHNVKHMLTLMAPAALGAGVAQVNLLIDVILASTFESGVSYLYYADRLNELPLGVIGVAIGTVLLPMLSKQLRNNEISQARYSINRAIEMALLLALPAAIALIILPLPLITLLFEHGEFSRADTLASFPALIAYAVGLPAFILIKIFAPGFFAHHDTKTPVKIAIICVGINLLLNLLLMQFMAHIGLALATSIAGWVNATLMGYVLLKRRVFMPDRTLILRLVRILLACMIFAALLLVVSNQMLAFYSMSLTSQIFILSAIVGGAIVIYGILAYWLHAVDREMVRVGISNLRQKIGKHDTA